MMFVVILIISVFVMLMKLVVGVIVMRFVIVFDMMLSIDGLFFVIYLVNIQLSVVQVVVICVVSIVKLVWLLVVIVEFVLKLNQLIYSIELLIIVSIRLCGVIDLWLQLMCLLSMRYDMRFVILVLMCIIVLFVKLSMLLVDSQLVGFYIMCVIGMQMISDQSVMNMSIVENFIWLVNVLQISVGVMIVNVIWQMKQIDFGIVVVRWLIVSVVVLLFLMQFMLCRNVCDRLLMKLLFGVNVRLQLIIVYSIVIIVVIVKFCIMVVSMFFLWIMFVQNSVRFGIVMNSMSVVDVSIYVVLFVLIFDELIENGVVGVVGVVGVDVVVVVDVLVVFEVGVVVVVVVDVLVFGVEVVGVVVVDVLEVVVVGVELVVVDVVLFVSVELMLVVISELVISRDIRSLCILGFFLLFVLCVLLQCVCVCFFGVNLDYLFDWCDEDFVVVDFVCVCGLFDCFYCLVDEIVGYGCFDFYFWQEIDYVFGVVIQFGVFFLVFEFFYFCYCDV